jgi:hypothetical protein
MNRRLSKRVAPFPNHGSRAPEDTFSLDVEFHDVNSPVESWMKTFPDPSNTPAHHTRSLSIYGPPTIPQARVRPPGFAPSPRRKALDVDTIWWDVKLVRPLHGLSPTLKSLILFITPSHPQRSSTLSVPSLLSRIWHWNPSPARNRRTSHSIDLTKTHRDPSVGQREWIRPMYTDCWPSQAVSTSPRSDGDVFPFQTQSQQ